MTYIELKYQERRIENVLVLMKTLREEFPLNKIVQESWRSGLVVEHFLTVSQALLSIPFTEKEKETKANNRKQANETSLDKEGLNCSCLDRDGNEQNKFTPPADGMVP